MTIKQQSGAGKVTVSASADKFIAAGNIGL
jgi:hypothetical protein